MADPFIGEIRMLASNFAPRGFLMCTGQLLPVNQNQAMFALLGTAYGGNGVSNFGLPDFQGRSPMGWGQGAGLQNYPIGLAGGSETLVQTNANMPAHVHNLVATGNTSLSGTSNLSGANTLPGTNTNQVVNAAGTSTTPIAGGCLGVANDGSGTSFFLYHSGKDNSGNPLPRVNLATSPVSVAGTVTVSGTTTVSGPVALPATTAVSGSNMPINLHSPFLAVSFVIATQGIYPTRN